MGKLGTKTIRQDELFLPQKAASMGKSGRFDNKKNLLSGEIRLSNNTANTANTSNQVSKKRLSQAITKQATNHKQMQK